MIIRFLFIFLGYNWADFPKWRRKKYLLQMSDYVWLILNNFILMIKSENKFKFEPLARQTNSMCTYQAFCIFSNKIYICYFPHC